jgi:hypothetical protein
MDKWTNQPTITQPRYRQIRSQPSLQAVYSSVSEPERKNAASLLLPQRWAALARFDDTRRHFA